MANQISSCNIVLSTFLKKILLGSPTSLNIEATAMRTSIKVSNDTKPGLDIIKLFSCSTQLRTKIILLINVEIAGTLTSLASYM